ncbi:MAG: nitroreductase/quinone reductase family protein [Anaerolineae bacterium]
MNRVDQVTIGAMSFMSHYGVKGEEKREKGNGGRAPLMNGMDPAVDQKWPINLAHFSGLTVLAWRLGLGHWAPVWSPLVGQMMILGHAVRKGGRYHRIPVHYALIDGEVFCLPTFGDRCGWYHKVHTNPEVEIWLSDSWWAGIAEEVTDPRLRVPLLRQVLLHSGLFARAAGLEPHVMTNEELAVTTRHLRLIKILRTRPCTGPGGPGDLAWVWQVTTGVLLLILLSRRKKR